jgi:PKD repeat protein
MIHAPSPTRRFMLLALAASALLLGVLLTAAQAHAAGVYGALGKLGEVKFGEGGSPGEINTGGRYGFVADPKTGDLFLTDIFEKTEGKTPVRYARVQELDSKGKALSETRIELPAKVVEGEEKIEANISSLQLAVDSERERVYLLVVDERPELSEHIEDKIEKLEEKLETLEKELAVAKGKKETVKVAQLEKEIAEVRSELAAIGYFDPTIPAAAELYSVSFKSGKLTEEKLLTGRTALKPFVNERRVPLLYPSGLAVDPTTHDVLITGQWEEGEQAFEDEEEVADPRAVVQRVHTESENDLGPRYVDEQDCLDSGEDFKEGEECAKGESDEEFPSSPVVTPDGKLYVEEWGAADGTEGGEIWELPASANASKHFKVGEAVEAVPVSPGRLFTLGETPELHFELNEELAGFQGESMSFVSEGSGTGTFYVLTNVKQGALKEEQTRTGLTLIDYSEAGPSPHASERGWTGAGPPAPPTSCTIAKGAGANRIAGVAGERALVLSAGTREKISYAEILGFGPGGTACGHTEVSAPRVEVGEDTNATEVEAGKDVTVLSQMAGADALSAKWQFKYRTKAGEEGEETAETGYQYRRPELKHAFGHVGEYEIVETVTTDCLGELTVSTVRKGLVVTPAPITLKLVPPAGAKAGEAVSFKANVSDPDETPAHLRYTWSFGDGSTLVEEASISGPKTLEATHTFSSPGAYKVGLTVEDAGGSKGEGAIEIAVTEEPPPPVEKTPPPVEETPPPGGGGGPPGGGVEHELITANPEAKLAGTSISVSTSGALALKVSCPTGESSCIGTVTLRTLSAVSAKRGKHTHKAILTLAKGSFTVAGGKVELVKLRLSSKARALLAHSHVLRARATLVAHDSAGVMRTVNTVVTLRLTKPHHHKRHKH